MGFRGLGLRVEGFRGLGFRVEMLMDLLHLVAVEERSLSYYIGETV